MTPNDTVPDKPLIFIPTYNEKDNVTSMCEQLLALDLDADILFMDDGSPDGTGEILDALAAKHSNVSVVHRAGKQGIGTAHQQGIALAYKRGYKTLITMDCDFTHSPSDIARLLEKFEGADIVLGSRYLQKDSLPHWSLLRKFLTNVGHLLTKRLLKIEHDATGAFRVYNLERIPARLFEMVTSRGYSFFFESLFLLVKNRFEIVEVPIVLPARTYGSSKMSLKEASWSARYLIHLYVSYINHPGRYRLSKDVAEIDESLVDPQNWDAYWDEKKGATGIVYETVAAIYRNLIIRRCLTRAIRKNFTPGSELLHAGCGSGQVDADTCGMMQVTAVDISVSALQLYQRNNPDAKRVKHATIFDLPFPNGSFDGVYNLGVMEHFHEPEIEAILCQFNRVLKRGGQLVFFWPHARATSVVVLDSLHWVIHRVFKKKTLQLHPPEVTRMRSRKMAEALLQKSGFEVTSYGFGPRDLFVQVVLVAKKV
jgi:dolichol-phosphate mannosyltransferase